MENPLIHNDNNYNFRLDNTNNHSPIDTRNILEVPKVINDNTSLRKNLILPSNTHNTAVINHHIPLNEPFLSHPNPHTYITQSSMHSETPHFNMKLNYHGQVNDLNREPVLELSNIDKRVKRIESLDKSDLKNLLRDLKISKNTLENTNKQIYNSINRYGNQINIILDSLKEEMNETENELKSLVVEVPTNEKPYIMRELEDEYSKSLNGYTINKNNYVHLKNVDPKELQEISNSVKSSLNTNNDFYLHNDYELI